jgi:hypothetical protein
MNGSNFIQGWVAIVGSLAILAFILTALGLMLGVVKPADALRYFGAILAITIVLTLIPGVLVSAWSGLNLWERIALVVIGIIAWQLRRLRPKTSRRRD